MLGHDHDMASRVPTPITIVTQRNGRTEGLLDNFMSHNTTKEAPTVEHLLQRKQEKKKSFYHSPVRVAGWAAETHIVA